MTTPTDPTAVIHVGSLRVSRAEAVDLVTQYATHADGVYSWPAYDHLATTANPNELADGDLLAPVLLNAAPSIVAFEGLQRQRHRIEDMLRCLPLHVDLVDATPDHLALIGALYAVLDDPKIRGVQGTTLSKVLHRKRPMLIPLYDSHVFDVYCGEGDHPLPPAGRNERTWREFMTLLAGAMQADIARSALVWDTIRAAAPEGDMTRLRALDIVAWRLAPRSLGARSTDGIASDE